MQGRTIDPKDVPQMFKDGTLWHGIELEFSQDFDVANSTVIARLIGYDEDAPAGYLYLARKDYESNPASLTFKYARFPLPDLRDGDPVLVKPYEGYTYWVHRIFSNFSHSGRSINVYDDGCSRWTAGDSRRFYEIWRIPNPDELEAAGLDRDWYKGCRGIKQCQS